MSEAAIQRTIELGRLAQELLDSEFFAVILEDLKGRHTRALLDSPPGVTGRASRDHHHVMHHALTEIESEVAGMVLAAMELKAALEQADKEDYERNGG